MIRYWVIPGYNKCRPDGAYLRSPDFILPKLRPAGPYLIYRIVFSEIFKRIKIRALLNGQLSPKACLTRLFQSTGIPDRRIPVDCQMTFNGPRICISFRPY